MLIEKRRALVGPGNRILHVERDDNHLLAHCAMYADYPGVSASGKFGPDHYLTDCVVVVGTPDELAPLIPPGV